MQHSEASDFSSPTLMLTVLYCIFAFIFFLNLVHCVYFTLFTLSILHLSVYSFKSICMDFSGLLCLCYVFLFCSLPGPCSFYSSLLLMQPAECSSYC